MNHKKNFTAFAILLLLLPALVCTAQKAPKMDEYDYSPLVDVRPDFPYELVQRDDGYSLQLSGQVYTITITKNAKASLPDEMHLKGKYKASHRKSGLSSAVKAHYMLLVPGVGLVGWNESKRGNAQGGFVDWILRPDGVIQHAKREEFVWRTAIKEDGIIAKKVFYGYSYPNNGSDMLIYGTRFKYPAKAYLMKDGKIQQTWDPLVNLQGHYTDHKYIDAMDLQYIQFALHQDESLVNVVTFDQDLNEISSYNDVQWTLNPPYARIRKAELLVPHPEIDGWYGILQRDGQVSVPEGALGMLPLARELSLDFFSLIYFKSVSYLEVHQYLLPYPQENGDLLWGLMNARHENATGPIWKDWNMYYSERIVKDNGVTRVSPRVLTGEKPNGQWEALNVFAFSDDANVVENINAVLDQIRPAATSAAALAQLEDQVIALNQKLQLEKDKRTQMQREEMDRLARVRAQQKKELEEYNREWEAQRQKSAGTAPSGSSATGFTYTKEVTDRYNQAVQQAKQRQEMLDHKRKMDEARRRLQ